MGYSPRCSLFSSSLVCIQNRNYYVLINPLLKKELIKNILWWHKFSTCTRRRVQVLQDKFVIRINFSVCNQSILVSQSICPKCCYFFIGLFIYNKWIKAGMICSISEDLYSNQKKATNWQYPIGKLMMFGGSYPWHPINLSPIPSGLAGPLCLLFKINCMVWLPHHRFFLFWKFCSTYRRSYSWWYATLTGILSPIFLPFLITFQSHTTGYVI